jgi:hypothetical protein
VHPKRFLSQWYVWRKPCTYLAMTRPLSPYGLNRDSTRPMVHRRSIGCIQSDFSAYATFSANRAPILSQDNHYLRTDQNEHPLEPRHLGVPSGVSKTISEPMVPSTQTVQLSCIQISTISKQTKTSVHLSVVT